MLAVIIFVLALYCFPATENGVTGNKRAIYVLTKYGKVRGHSADDGDYLAFLGIPYAAPPTGDDRFKSPKPPQPWKGLYDAIRTTKCPQKGQGDEDCLILNIFTPLITPDQPLPVLVYIHGGSFIMGGGPSSGMEYLIKQNIIVVTFNYRLGPLGFLCLGIEEAPGNVGLKDQEAALTYIKNNIDRYGGDPDQITVYGTEAGGASAEYLILAKMNKKLFHRVIIESGSINAPWALDRNPVQTAKNVAKLLDIPDTDFSKILYQHLKKIPTDILTDISFDYYKNLTDATYGFAPCVESYISGVNHFITSSPVSIMKQGNFFKFPKMYLFTTLEGLYLRSSEIYELQYKERMEWNILNFMPADLVFENDTIRNGTAKKIKRFYFGNGTDDVIPYLNYFGDSYILHSLLNTVESHNRSCYGVYLMEFAYKGQIGGYDQFYETINVAGHGDVAKYAILNEKPMNAGDRETVQRITNLIANYVKFGNPTPIRTAVLPIRWPTVSPDTFSCLYLDREFAVFTAPYWDRKTFWDKIYAKSKKYN